MNANQRAIQEALKVNLDDKQRISQPIQQHSSDLQAKKQNSGTTRQVKSVDRQEDNFKHPKTIHIQNHALNM